MTMIHQVLDLRKAFLLLISSLSISGLLAQDRIFAIGYTKNFVTSDSSNLSFTLDFNRTPGKSESGGSYYIVSIPVFEKFNFFLKPTADINLGSYTALAANNVAVGIPFGLARKLNADNPTNTRGNLIGSLEAGPDLVADKSFTSYLYYFSPKISLNYSLYTKSETLFEIGTSLQYSAGERLQSVKTKIKNKYRKFLLPIGIIFNGFKAKQDYYHLKFSTVYKFNQILKDNPINGYAKSNIYFQSKLDYFFISQLGINFTYTSGYEEPFFKKVHSLAIGIALARKG